MIMNQDIIIRSSFELPVAEADNQAIHAMEAAAKEAKRKHKDERQRIHLILRNQHLADVLKRTPLSDELAQHVELYAYTCEDLWSMQMIGVQPGSATRLDRKPIGADSRQHVHLVIFGISAQACSLAVHTALIAHYPNYCADHSLRTRITMVSDGAEDFRGFQQHYRHLLMHSYRRTVDAEGKDVACETMLPKYQGERDDFVDIEWEFVQGHSDDKNLQYKLQKWAQDEGQQLTVAFCYKQDERNLNEALGLPTEMHNTPVWVHVEDDVAIRLIRQSGQWDHLIAFGMRSSALPDMRRFIRMAQCVSYAYHQMRTTSAEEQAQGMNTMAVATEIPTAEELVKIWNEKPIVTSKLWSNIYCAFSLTTKMHSLGHDDADWRTLFAIGEKEVRMMAEVEHNRWNVEELVLGYRPTTDEEHEQIRQDISLRSVFKQQWAHDDLRSFREIGNDETGQNVFRYDIALTRSLPLIAYMYHCLKDEGNE